MSFNKTKIDLFYSCGQCGENTSSKLVERHQEEMTEESSVDSHLTLDVTTTGMTQVMTSSGIHRCDKRQKNYNKR